MPRQFVDAQAALAFMINQASYIEAEVYRTQYPEIIYPQLIPVDESAPEWTKSITFFSIESSGRADWFHHNATDMRLADVTRSAYEQGVDMAGIGYRYTLAEIGEALQAGFALNPERAAAAVRGAEQFIESVALIGDIAKGWTGLINAANVTVSTVANTGTGPSTLWSTKTADLIISDLNIAIAGIYSATNTVEIPDTILLPVEQYTLIATKRLSDTSEMSILDWFQKYNVYTAQTGRSLTIRALRQLDGAGTSPASSDRMMIYRRDPSVLKMHLPMRHRFLPVWQTGPIVFDVPGIMRLGGTEVRRPAAVHYWDGI